MSSLPSAQLRTGRRDNPTKRHLEALAQFFQVPVAYFFDDDQGAAITRELELLGVLRDAGVRSVALRALTLSPNEASILNNLALAHTMLGEADKAEPLLKRAAAAGGNEARVSQNLALVLGLQGKYDEAKVAAGRDLPADKAAENVEYVRSIVNLEPQVLTTGGVSKPDERAPEVASGWTTKVAATKAAR